MKVKTIKNWYRFIVDSWCCVGKEASAQGLWCPVCQLGLMSSSSSNKMRINTLLLYGSEYCFVSGSKLNQNFWRRCTSYLKKKPRCLTLTCAINITHVWFFFWIRYETVSWSVLGLIGPFFKNIYYLQFFKQISTLSCLRIRIRITNTH
jgi:hypothetical protein